MNILVAQELPQGTASVSIDVSLKHEKFVHYVIHFVSARGEVLWRRVARCGRDAWQTFNLPSARTYCASLGIPCEVREVSRSPRRPRPRKP